MDQRAPTLADTRNFRTGKINLPVDPHEQLHGLNLRVVRAQRTTRVHKIVSQVIDGISKNFESAASLG